MLTKTHISAAVALSLMAGPSVAACHLDFREQTVMRAGFCGGAQSAPGCTSDLMTLQVADQFKQIALARRCGYQKEADELDKYYKLTTPLVVKLYECVDKAIDRPAVEKAAQKNVEDHLKALPEGCPAELKSKMATTLPKLIQADKTSLDEVKKVSEKLGLEK